MVYRRWQRTNTWNVHSDGQHDHAPFGLTNLDVHLLTIANNTLYAVTTTGIFKAID